MSDARTATVEIFGTQVRATMLGHKMVVFESEGLKKAMSEEKAKAVPSLMREYFGFLGADGLVELTTQGKDRLLCETIAMDKSADPSLREFASAVVHAHIILGEECDAL